MKRLFGIFAVLLAGCATTAQADDDIVLNATVAITDGSSIKGELKTDEIEGKTVFDDDFEIDCALVKSLAFQGTNASAKVTLVNGDQLAMTVETKSFKLNSSLGELAIPRESIRSLSIAKRSTKVGAAEAGLVYACSFDSKECVLSPLNGEAGRLLNASFLPDGKNGGALSVSRGLPAVELPITGKLANAGCIEFWAKLESGKTEFSTGGDPRFFTIYRNGTQELGTFEYASNTGYGASGLHACFKGGNAASGTSFYGVMPYSEIFKGKPYENWHHYAMVWDDKGIDSLPGRPTIAILLDGTCLNNVYHAMPQSISSRGFDKESMTLAIPMREQAPSFNSKSPFLIDDLKIWNFAKTEFVSE